MSNYPKQLRVNGIPMVATNGCSSGPGCEVHTYQLLDGRTVRKSFKDGAWLLEGKGHGVFLPEVSGWGEWVVLEVL